MYSRSSWKYLAGPSCLVSLGEHWTSPNCSGPGWWIRFSVILRCAIILCHSQYSMVNCPNNWVLLITPYGFISYIHYVRISKWDDHTRTMWNLTAGVAPGGQVRRGGQRMPKVYLERGGIPELMWSTHNSWAILMIKHDQPPYFSFFSARFQTNPWESRGFCVPSLYRV